MKPDPGWPTGSLVSRFQLISLQSNPIRQRLTFVCNIIISLTPGPASNVWCVTRRWLRWQQQSNNNIISSPKQSLASQHLYHPNIWPFLVPAHGIQSVASFCHLTSREEFSQAILSLDTFNNFTRVSSEICKTKYISQSSDCVSITSHKDHNYNPVTGLWPQSESQYLKFFKIWRFILRSVSHILYPSTFKK